MRRPTVYLGCIARNESRDIGRMLKSAMPAVDGLILIDTGSSDNTVQVAYDLWPKDKDFYAETYLKASDENGLLVDFSKARNHYLEIAAQKCDWILSLDADDELMTPDAIRRASFWMQLDGFALWIQDGGVRWLTHRCWKASMGARYEGRAHEYPDLHNMKLAQLDSALIVHHGEPSANQEDSNVRNLRILMLEWKENPSARAAFYIANTHRDGGRWEEAAKWYYKRITMGEAYRDEWLFAHLYGCRAHWHAGNKEFAKTLAMDGMKAQPDWKEFALELARFYYDEKQYAKCIEYAQPCVRAPIPPTNLWREPSAYTDQPARLISWSHEHLGNWGQALAWSEVAKELIGGPDREWDERHDRLRKLLLIGGDALDRRGLRQTPDTDGSDGTIGKANVVTGGAHPKPRIDLHQPDLQAGIRGAAESVMREYASSKPRIALHRPGAIGDILMTLNLVPLLKQKYPDHAIDYFTAWGAEDQLGNIIKAAGCDDVYTLASVDTLTKDHAKVFNLIGYPIKDGYPEKKMQYHLLNYFAEEMGVSVPYYVDGSINRELPYLSLPKPPEPLKTGPYATIQRKAGWSKYKEWPEERWDEVVRGLNRAGIPVYEIDEKQGLPLSTVIAIFANARMHLGIDSFCNHLSHYLWDGKRVPAVILWGSTQWDAAGYPENVNISKGLACQPCFRETHPNSLHPRGPCINLTPAGTHSCMDQISVDEVLKEAVRLWEKTNETNETVAKGT